MKRSVKDIMVDIQSLPRDEKNYLLNLLCKNYKKKNTPKSSIVVFDKESDPWCGEDDFWNEGSKTK